MTRFPIIASSIAYGAGLATGLVFLVPVGVILVPLALAALVVIRTGRGGAMLFLFPGMIIGTAQGTAVDAQCRSVLPAGEIAIWLVVHDTPVDGRVGSAHVTNYSTKCSGEVGVVFDGVQPGAGDLGIAAGNVRRGIVRVEHWRTVRPGFSLRYRLRGLIQRRIESLFGRRSGIVTAMVLGARSGIDPRVREQFVDAGLAHLLAISGLHVGIIAGWIYLLGGIGPLARSRNALVVGGTWSYVALLAFPASAVRAAAFVTLGVVARKIQRTPPASVVLAVAADVVFSLDPEAVRSPGAWLSIAAVWGTALAAREARRFNVTSPPARLIASSIGATVMTAPITALVFGSVAPAGIVTNLLGVPIAGVLVPAVLFALATGSVMASGAGILLWGLEGVARIGAQIPAGHFAGDGLLFWLPWLLLAVGVTFAVSGRPTGPTLRLRIVRLISLPLVFMLVPVLTPGLSDRAGLTVFVLDVGQGDAIAIRTPGNRWAIVDGGPAFGEFDAGERTVVPFLERMGVKELSAAFVSHGDADHVGGVASILARHDADYVSDPGQPLESSLYTRYLEAVRSGGARWRAARRGDRIVIDSVSFTVIHPDSGWISRRLEPNENSVVVLLEYRSFSMLLTGDAGLPAESVFVGGLPEIDVLKVGHHGSRSSTSTDLLRIARPRAAVISVGAENSYGHPSARVIRHLREAGVDVFRTDLSGTVTIWSNGDYFDIRQEKRMALIQRFRCLLQTSLRLNGSSSSRSECTRMQPGNSRTYSTTSRSPGR